MTNRQPKKRRETLSRQIRIESLSLDVGVRVDKNRGLPPEQVSLRWIEVRGRCDEPLRDVHEFGVSLHVEDPRPEPTSVGAIIQIRPTVRAVIGMPAPDFDRVWALANSGQLKFCHLAFFEPKRGTALVTAASFYNEEEK